MIHTRRLILREFEQADAQALYELNQDPEVLKHTGDLPFENQGEALDFVKAYEQYSLYGFGRWAMVLKNTRKVIGWCGLKFHINTMEIDLGFRLLRKHWNKGFATEAALACLKHGFTELGIEEIIGRARKENRASICVLEKIGMQNPKTINFEGHEGLQFTLTKKEYESRRKLSGY